MTVSRQNWFDSCFTHPAIGVWIPKCMMLLSIFLIPIRILKTVAFAPEAILILFGKLSALVVGCRSNSFVFRPAFSIFHTAIIPAVTRFAKKQSITTAECKEGPWCRMRTIIRVETPTKL